MRIDIVADSSACGTTAHPLFGGALAMLFLGERPDLAYGVGALLVFGGLALGASTPARHKR